MCITIGLKEYMFEASLCVALVHMDANKFSHVWFLEEFFNGWCEQSSYLTNNAYNVNLKFCRLIVGPIACR